MTPRFAASADRRTTKGSTQSTGLNRVHYFRFADHARQREATGQTFGHGHEIRFNVCFEQSVAASESPAETPWYSIGNGTW
jgi:hypothetical protein